MLFRRRRLVFVARDGPPLLEVGSAVRSPVVLLLRLSVPKRLGDDAQVERHSRDGGRVGRDVVAALVPPEERGAAVAHYDGSEVAGKRGGLEVERV